MTSLVAADAVAELRARSPQMVEALAALVAEESPSSDPIATAVCAATAGEIGAELMGAFAERIVVGGYTHLLWRFGADPNVLLMGHLDTVWPLGTTSRWPFEVRDEIASGPGCFDMKAGVVQLFHAVSLLENQDGVTILLTTDEETGSLTSRDLIEKTAGGLQAALVLEPSGRGALKTERKGAAAYEIRVQGRAAHAGLEPEVGVNATIELAHHVLAIAALERPEVGTTVTPTIIAAGSSQNTVPGTGALFVDVRTSSADEQARVDRALRALLPQLTGATLDVRGDVRPPLPRAAAAGLFARAQRLASGLGLPALEEVSVGGGSDGNLIAALGVPTLDGLGAVGGGAHAEGEHVELSAMPERAALVAALIADLLTERPTGR